MSNKNRVNPDHYKVAGRDAQGEDFTPELNRQAFGREIARLRHGRTTSNFIPGAAPVGEAPPNGDVRGNKGMGMQASAKRGVKSTSQKQGSSRHYTAPSPQTAPVAGAFGKEGENGQTSRRGPAGSAGTARRRGGAKVGARKVSAKKVGAKKVGTKIVGARKTVGKKAPAKKAGSARRSTRRSTRSR
jgi:hypothetical protein